MKKVTIVEDEVSIRKELKETLESAGYQVSLVTDFQNTLENILQTSPDLILLDINLPQLNGEFILKELRVNHNIPVIMLTSRVGEIEEVLCMSYGADDYITKPYNPTILLLRMSAILKRLDQKNPTLKYHDATIIPTKSIIQTPDQELILTKNELIIFTHLLNNQGKIVSRDELMTELWNNEEYINDNALTVSISRLRNKLKEIHLEDAIITRKGQGYILQ